MSELALLLAQSKRGQQVNSVFGEGVNPRLRKIRDGLDALGLPTDDLLNHGGPRLVYGVALPANTRAYLLCLDEHPRYTLGQKAPRRATQQIARWWEKQWLLPRGENGVNSIFDGDWGKKNCQQRDRVLCGIVEVKA